LTDEDNPANKVSEDKKDGDSDSDKGSIDDQEVSYMLDMQGC